ncbi:unnamed protein product [Chironomus riparius]|uniref:WW domain-containing protein n=1 Tax=Chironomus riparius TaxID=315576 RepID=A0A9N9S6X9_9DIPT|nr:unnamed protein product [Chironomus riparius]
MKVLSVLTVITYLALLLSQCSAKAFIRNWISGIFGESLHNYRYDLQSGTSYYHRSDGTVDSWQSPQSREFYPNSYNIVEKRHHRGPSKISNKGLQWYTDLFLR